MGDDYTPDLAYAEAVRVYRLWSARKLADEAKQEQIMQIYRRAELAEWEPGVLAVFEERLKNLASRFNRGETARPLPTYMGGKRQGPNRSRW